MVDLGGLVVTVPLLAPPPPALEVAAEAVVCEPAPVPVVEAGPEEVVDAGEAEDVSDDDDPALLVLVALAVAAPWAANIEH